MLDALIQWCTEHNAAAFNFAAAAAIFIYLLIPKQKTKHRIVRHRAPAERRTREQLRRKTHQVKRSQAGAAQARKRRRVSRVRMPFTILNRMRHVLQPAMRFGQVEGSFKTYDASLAFAAAQKIAANLSMAVARTLAPQTLAEALSGLKGKWSHLSAATPTVVLNRLSMLGHSMSSAVILYLRPVSHAFNEAASWTGQLSGAVSDLFARLTSQHDIRRLHPAVVQEIQPQPEPHPQAQTLPTPRRIARQQQNLIPA